MLMLWSLARQPTRKLHVDVLFLSDEIRAHALVRRRDARAFCSLASHPVVLHYTIKEK